MNPLELQLKPEQAAVILCLQRLTAQLSMEAAQLRNVYGQSGAAKSLENVAEQLHAHGERFLQNAQRSIVIAHEMPKPNGVIDQ